MIGFNPEEIKSRCLITTKISSNDIIKFLEELERKKKKVYSLTKLEYYSDMNGKIANTIYEIYSLELKIKKNIISVMYSEINSRKPVKKYYESISVTLSREYDASVKSLISLYYN